jgi:CDP-diacylglycerol---glycerol-3-phosphate 3-phosphatidyltransferase
MALILSVTVGWQSIREISRRAWLPAGYNSLPALDGPQGLSRNSAARHKLVGVFPLNLPNVLTVLRIMLVPALVVALLGNTPAGDVLAAVVFALASLTDFVDGYLARARDSVTTFGKLMDPLADKLLVVAALISLVSLHRLAAWVAMVIITRELAVTVLRVAATQAGVVMAASLFGKVKTFLQIAAILAVIAVHGQPLWVSALLYLTVLVTVLSGLDYFFGLRRRMQQAQARGASG